MLQKLILFLCTLIASPITGVTPQPPSIPGPSPIAASCDAERLSPSERAESIRTVATVARELGASPAARRLLIRWANRESHANPATRHELPADRAAASSPRARKAILAMGRVFEDGRWGHGRGLYGMQPAFYLRRWDPSADPDVLCDPIVATVTAIWAARDHAKECRRAGHEPTILVASRRWGSGHCRPRARDHSTQNFWRERGVDPHTPVSWGRDWPEESTDRDELYAHLLEKTQS
jgi:hypothetical protein